MSTSASTVPAISLFERLVSRLVVVDVEKSAFLKFEDGMKVENLLREKRVEDRMFLGHLLRPKDIPDAQLDFDIMSKNDFIEEIRLRLKPCYRVL